MKLDDWPPIEGADIPVWQTADLRMKSGRLVRAWRSSSLLSGSRREGARVGRREG
jgi:hypothetical protein